MKPPVKNALYLVFQLSKLLKSSRPEVPPTRDELIGSGTSKKHLQELERLGLATSQVLVLVEGHKGGGKNVHGRCVYQLTSLGHEACHQLGFVPVEEIPQGTPTAEAPIQEPAATP